MCHSPQIIVALQSAAYHREGITSVKKGDNAWSRPLQTVEYGAQHLRRVNAALLLQMLLLEKAPLEMTQLPDSFLYTSICHP